MASLTIGFINKAIKGENILLFLKKNNGIRELKSTVEDFSQNICYTFQFLYSSELEDGAVSEEMLIDDDFEERTLTCIEVAFPYNNSDKDIISEFNLNEHTLTEGYTYLYLGAWGSSVHLVTMIIRQFGEGYIIPNNDCEKILHVTELNHSFTIEDYVDLVK